MRFGRASRRFSRHGACAASGATLDELCAFEREGLLVPHIDRWPPWGHREPYYLESQVEVLRWLVSSRRQARRCSVG
jgi:hypothetical protein